MKYASGTSEKVRYSSRGRSLLFRFTSWQFIICNLVSLLKREVSLLSLGKTDMVRLGMTSDSKLNYNITEVEGKQLR